MLAVLGNTVVALVMLASSSVASAQQDTTKVDISGTWNFSVTYEGGQGSPTVRLTQKGDSLTGLYISQAFGELDVKGTIKGREFSFGFTTSAGGDPFSMTFNGTVESNESLKGSLDMGNMGAGSFTARRARQ